MGTFRIFAAGVGGIAGLMAWYLVVATTQLWPVFLTVLYGHGQGNGKLMGIFVGSLLLCGFGAGALVLLAGERLRLFPSPEEMDRRSRPASLFSNEDQDRRT